VDVSDVQSAVDITKKVVANKMIINETSGDVKLFADDDSTSTLVTSGMTNPLAARRSLFPATAQQIGGIRRAETGD